MDICLKSTQKQTEDATAIEPSISEEKPRVYDDSNLCLDRGKLETIQNVQFEASGTDFTEALDQLNARPKEEQVTGIDDLLSTIKDSLNYLAGLESLTEEKEKKNPSQNEVREPPGMDIVTLQNNCFSESIKDIDKIKISSEKSLGLKTSAKHIEIAGCSNSQSRSAQKKSVNDTCDTSVSERNGLVSDIKAESNELNEIAIELLNLLAEDEPTEKPTESNDVVETLQVALESLSGQQSIQQERSNEGTSLALKEEDAERGSKALPPGLPTSVSAEVNGIIGNEVLRTESRVDITSVANKDITINSTDVTRDSILRSLLLNTTSVTNNDVPMNSTDITRDSVRRSSRLNSAVQRQKDSCRGNMVTHNVLKVGLHTRNNLIRRGKNKKRIRNSSKPSTSLFSQPRESNRTLSQETLGAGQSVAPKDSNLDFIQMVAAVYRSARCKADKPAVCSLCGEEFPKGEADLSVHIQEAHKRFKCEKCDKSFEQPYLKQHVRNVHENSGRKNVPCEICDKLFKSVTSLRHHIRYVHEKSENMATCSKCGKEIVKSSLRNHLLIHAVERNYSCSVCNKKFTTKHGLLKHMEKHDETRIPCEKCGSRVKKYAFKEHMRKHGLSFQCEICGAKLSRAETFKLHMSTHTGEQPFVCEKCGRKFARKYNLDTHLKLHAGIRKLVCDLCKRTFAQKWNLRTHMQSCQKNFSRMVTK